MWRGLFFGGGWGGILNAKKKTYWKQNLRECIWKGKGINQHKGMAEKTTPGWCGSPRCSHLTLPPAIFHSACDYVCWSYCLSHLSMFFSHGLGQEENPVSLCSPGTVQCCWEGREGNAWGLRGKEGERTGSAQAAQWAATSPGWTLGGRGSL